MRRFVIALIAMATTVASASSPWSSDDDDIPKVTDPSVPLTYVGGDGSISIGFNADGETEGQLMGVFARNDERAVVGQLWWDRSGAGGLQGDYNWLWGATAAEVREDPSKATVARLSFAVAQNSDHNRKATLGFGIERRDYSIDAYLSRGFDGGRSAGSVFDDVVNPITGSDDIGTYTELETTSIETLLKSKAYDTEFGVQFSHVFDPLGMRVYGGAGLQNGEGSASARIFSAGIDSPLGRRGWAMSSRVEHQRRQGDFETDLSDTRVSFFLRYQFGGRGVFVPTSDQTSPAWVQRAFGRASNAAPRTVDSYVSSSGSVVTVSRGPRVYSNHFPLAQPDSAATSAGTAVAIDVLANDADPDGDPLIIAAVSQPANGTAMIEGTRIVYTPAPAFIGIDSFTYTVADPEGGTGSATVTISVDAIVTPNQPPVARDDQATTQADTPITIGVLANDIDADDDSLTIIDVGPAAHGTVVLTGDRITYTPQAGFTGTDTFTYTISDGNGGTATATVQVTITQTPNRDPIANGDNAVTLSGTPVAVAVLANDFDPDGDALAIVGAGTPSFGAALVTGGVIVYTPNAGFSGNDSFPYAITDGRGGSASAIVSVRVDATLNNPPVAQDDAATTTSGAAVTIPVLANDSDPDGDPLSILAVGAPSLGTATISGANILYTAAVGTGGTDTFSYTIGDGRGGTATANVVVTIGTAPNQPPVAVDDNVTIDPAIPTTIDVLSNDSDADGDPLTVVSVTTPAFGTATIAGNVIVYAANATFTGADAFDYTISDGRGGTATATVHVTGPTPPNNPPVAVDDNVTIDPAAPTVIDVLSNDSDADGDPLTVVSVTTPAFGTATIAGNVIVYAANATFTGADAFAYTISDGQGGTATATVHVTGPTPPNNPPVAVDDNVTIDPAAPTVIDVLVNDSDPDGDPLAIVSVTTPSFGTATIAGNTIMYTANPTFTGADAFAYTISDGQGGTATATVHVTGPTPPNNPPVAVDDTATTPAGAPVSIPVLANDNDPDGDPLTIASVTAPNVGSATIAGSAVVYQPFSTTFIGTDTFQYTINDGRGGTATATVVVTVTQPNQPPIANDDAALTDFGQTVVINVLNNDTDPDGDPLLIIATTQPMNGIVSFNNSTVTYSPNGGFSGVDVFTYTISDGRGGTDTAQVLVVVQ